MSDNNNIAILWNNLSFKSSGFSSSKKNLILNNINGLFHFDTINAIMGPSGCGKSTFLRCLNGQNRKGLLLETKIYSDSSEDLSSCFVVQDVEHHLFSGLTVGEWLIFSSKLKNYRKDQKVDHQSIISKLKKDFILGDIEKTLIKNCSGGEVKRIAIASELTSMNIPRLICIDEPTSGLDSNAAEIVMTCLKKITSEHHICIATSIHQPNAEILMLFDSLYILAKGGKCVYSGPPSEMRNQLIDCGINLREFDVPIQTIIKISSKGIENDSVYDFVRYTERKFKAYIKDKTVFENLSLKSIEQNISEFNIESTWNLFNRSLINKFRTQWIAILIQFVFIVTIGLVLCFVGNRENGKIDSCFPIAGSNTSLDQCSAGLEGLKLEFSITQNITYIFLVVGVLQFIQTVLSAISFSDEVQILYNEYRNGWYSASCYYWAKTFVELPVPVLITITYVYLSYYFSNQMNDEFRMIGSIFMIVMGVLCTQGIGFLFCVLINKNQQLTIISSIVLFLIALFFSDFFVPTGEMSFPMKLFSDFSFMKQTFHSNLIYIYGFDRCKPGTVSWVLQQFDLDQNEFSNLIKEIILVITHFITLRGLILTILIVKLK